MMGILLTVSYDGTNYCGWQIQPNDDTVQERLEKGLKDVYKKDITVLGASRTDAGVHAIGQRAHFNLESYGQGEKEVYVPLDKLPQVLNNYLSQDIIVTKAELTPCDFHPIADAKQKTYEYVILNQKYQAPKLRNYSYHVCRPLNFESMKVACGYFIGTHDFAAFSSVGGKVKSSVRTIYSCELVRDDNFIKLYITGNGFLYNMVRIIVGTLVTVGFGKIPPEDIADIIKSKDRKRAGETSPAYGLTLISVEYGDGLS